MENLGNYFLRFFNCINVQNLANSWKKPKIVIFFVLLLHLCITNTLAAKLNIWTDEAYSLDTSSKDLEYAISQAINFELQAPLYFAILNIWRSINHSIFFARLFSIVCILVTIYIATLLSKRLFRELHPIWIATAIALSPFSIWAAVEIRVYAFSILLSALLLLLFFDGYLANTPKIKAQLLYVLLSIIALYTYYFFACFLLTNAFVLLYLRRKQALRSYLLGMIFVGICFLPMLSSLASQLSLSNDPLSKNIDNSNSLFISLRMVIGGIFNYFLPVKIPSLPRDNELSGFWVISRYFFALTLIVFILKNRRLNNSSSIAIWSITITLSFVLFIVLGLAGIKFPRHTNLLFIPVLLSIFAAFSIVNGTTRRKALLLWLTITLFFNLTCLYTFYKPMAKDGDYARVASYIMANEKPNQAILVFNPEVAMILEYYYKGLNKLVPLPKKEDFQAYKLGDLILKDNKEIITALSRIPGEHQFIWLVVNPGVFNIAPLQDRSDQILAEFVNKYYCVKSSKDFYGSNVRFLHQKQEF